MASRRLPSLWRPLYLPSRGASAAWAAPAGRTAGVLVGFGGKGATQWAPSRAAAAPARLFTSKTEPSFAARPALAAEEEDVREEAEDEKVRGRRF